MPTTKHTAHTPGPWKVMSDPVNAGKHPFHDRRWITTEDAEVEFGHDPRSWGLSQGSLVCEMRDGPEANARLIAAAPDYSEATAEVLAPTPNNLARTRCARAGSPRVCNLN